MAVNKYFEIVHRWTRQPWRCTWFSIWIIWLKFLSLPADLARSAFLLKLREKRRSIKTHLPAVESSTRMKSLTEFIVFTKRFQRMSLVSTLKFSGAECFRERTLTWTKAAWMFLFTIFPCEGGFDRRLKQWRDWNNGARRRTTHATEQPTLMTCGVTAMINLTLLFIHSFIDQKTVAELWRQEVIRRLQHQILG